MFRLKVPFVKIDVSHISVKNQCVEYLKVMFMENYG